MAANFWTSTHFKQLIDADQVDAVHPIDKEKGLTRDEFRLIKIYMTIYIWKLAPPLKMRQRVIATATTYFRRVYTKKSMTEYDPRLVAPACLFLASKAEETTLQARHIVIQMRKTYVSDKKYWFEVRDILEMEMKILEALDFYLIVYHPYRPLVQFLQDAGLSDMTQIAWGFVNDTYKMDLLLVHPPHMIALACIYLACVLKDKDRTAWFEELRADMNTVKNISVEILELYEFCRPDAKWNIVIPEDRMNAALNKLSLKP